MTINTVSTNPTSVNPTDLMLPNQSSVQSPVGGEKLEMTSATLGSQFVLPSTPSLVAPPSPEAAGAALLNQAQRVASAAIANAESGSTAGSVPRVPVTDVPELSSEAEVPSETKVTTSNEKRRVEWSGTQIRKQYFDKIYNAESLPPQGGVGLAQKESGFTLVDSLGQLSQPVRWDTHANEGKGGLVSASPQVPKETKQSKEEREARVAAVGESIRQYAQQDPAFALKFAEIVGAPNIDVLRAWVALKGEGAGSDIYAVVTASDPVQATKDLEGKLKDYAVAQGTSQLREEGAEKGLNGSEFEKFMTHAEALLKQGVVRPDAVVRSMVEDPEGKGKVLPHLEGMVSLKSQLAALAANRRVMTVARDAVARMNKANPEGPPLDQAKITPEMTASIVATMLKDPERFEGKKGDQEIASMLEPVLESLDGPRLAAKSAKAEKKTAEFTGPLKTEADRKKQEMGQPVNGDKAWIANEALKSFGGVVGKRLEDFAKNVTKLFETKLLESTPVGSISGSTRLNVAGGGGGALASSASSPSPSATASDFLSDDRKKRRTAGASDLTDYDYV